MNKRWRKTNSESERMGSVPLVERVAVHSNAKRIADIAILLLLLSLLAYRVSLFHKHGFIWFLAFICEAWFTFVWLLSINIKWSPVIFNTYPQNLSKRYDDLPAVDMFVTTADPNLEPPIITVNTVLSLLAVDYEAEKLACYISDDASSPITFYSLVQASKFAKIWVPFCKKYNVAVRAPFVYFSRDISSENSSENFLEEWRHVKDEYTQLCGRIEGMTKDDLSHISYHEDFNEFKSIDRRNHESIIKVIHDYNSGIEYDVPHIVYLAREKRPKYHHHFKAGAMNVLTRVSGMMTNAPFMLNVDCDMFVNNPKVILYGMCHLLGFPNDACSGFVQAPQCFYGGLKDDPFGNQLQILQNVFTKGLAGIQGPFYQGTGCFHRRKIIYGATPSISTGVTTKNDEKLTIPKELQKVFGTSKEFIETVRQTMSKENAKTYTRDIRRFQGMLQQVASCTYEHNTCWGQEIGWIYGSMTEDVLTGLRIQSLGWASTFLNVNPPTFLGNAPNGGPESMVQYKRWATGLLEIFFNRKSPIIMTITRKLKFRQCLAYFFLLFWGVRSVFELCYALLPAYSIFANIYFMPKVSESGFIILLAPMLTYNFYTLIEYLQLGLSMREWWNNQRMQRIIALTSWFLSFITVILKIIGLSETIFEVTRKDQQSYDNDNHDDPSKFTFDSSSIFVVGTIVMLANMLAIAIEFLRFFQQGSGALRLAEFSCCVWIVLSFLPFVKGLVRKGKYGIPWIVIFKAMVFVFLFMQFSFYS